MQEMEWRWFDVLVTLTWTILSIGSHQLFTRKFNLLDPKELLKPSHCDFFSHKNSSRTSKFPSFLPSFLVARGVYYPLTPSLLVQFGCLQYIFVAWILTLWNQSVSTLNGKVPNLNWWWRKRLLLLASTWLLKSFQVSPHPLRWIVAVTKPRPVLIALRWLISKLTIPPFGFLDGSVIEDINCLGCREGRARAGAMETVSGVMASAYQVYISAYQVYHRFSHFTLCCSFVLPVSLCFSFIFTPV